MTRPLCLMLDVDGVLIDGRPEDGQNWATDIQKDLGLTRNALSDAIFKPFWTDIVTGQKDLMTVLTQALAQIAPEVSAETLIAYWFAKDSRIVQNVLTDVRKIRATGVPVHLATNQEHLRATYLMQDLKLRDKVDGMIYSARINCKKPDPAFFHHAEHIAGHRAAHLMLVDDTPENVAAARSAGWQAHLWTPGTSLAALLDLAD